MGYQGYILSNSQLIRQNATQLVFQGRLYDGSRFHWTVTRTGLVFFMDRDKNWTPPGAFRKSVELLSLRGKPVDALYFQTTSDLTRARGPASLVISPPMRLILTSLHGFFWNALSKAASHLKANRLPMHQAGFVLTCLEAMRQMMKLLE